MPWITPDDQPVDLAAAPQQPKADLAAPGVGETVGAAFRQENTVGSMLSNKTFGADLDTVEPGFDPWETAKGTKYEAYPDRLAGIFNRKAYDAWTSQIDREDEDRRTLDAAGWAGTFAEIGAGLVDLPSLIPAGRMIQAGKLGYSVARSALSVGAGAALGAAAQEAGLQASQETRPLSQSAIAIGGGAILGGAIGAAGAKLMDNFAWNTAAKAIEREVYSTNDIPADVAEREMKGLVDEGKATGGEEVAPGAQPRSAGAAAIDRPDKDKLTVYGRVARAATNATAQLNPLLRALTSPSAEQRAIMMNLMENPVYLKGAFEGEASPRAVETIVKAYQGAHDAATSATMKMWTDARKSGLQMKWPEFRARVGQAMRTGDMDEGGVDAIGAAAKYWRDRVFDPLKAKAIDAGLLPEDVTPETAESYFTRMYNVPMIEAREGEFKGIVRGWAVDEIKRQAETFADQAGKKVSSLQSEADDLEMGMLRRAEEARRREAGGEIAVDPETERQVLKAINHIKAKTKGDDPETLVQFLHRKGGLYDEKGELEMIGLSNKTRPGFVRKTRQSLINTDGGLDLDTAARMAWDEGFIVGKERPTPNDLLDLLAEGMRGRRIVRETDRVAAEDADVFDRVVADLERMGVDISTKKQLFSTADDLKGFAKRVAESLNARDRQRVAEIRKEIEEVKGGIEDAGRLSPEELKSYVDDMVEEIYRRITGREADAQGGSPFRIVANARGPLKERTFLIPDKLIAPFLVDDVVEVGHRYVRLMGADIELSRLSQRLGGDGKPDLAALIKRVQEDYARMRQGVTDEKALRKLNVREKADVRDMQAVRDMLRGNYLADENSKGYAKALNIAMGFNYLRTMGGVTLSSLTDAARPIVVHGLGRWMNDGVRPLLTNIRGFRMAKQEAALSGVIGENVRNAVLGTYADLMDPYTAKSPAERFLSNLSRKFSTLSGMPIWNDFQKGFASVITQNRILGNAGNWAKLSEKEAAYMHYLGIDQPMAERIAREFEEHGERIKNVGVAHSDEWTDALAVEAYRAAIAKDVDSIIVTKGVGDVPLFARTPVGRALLQFKGFSLAAHQRAFLRGMQEDQMALASGLISTTAVGAFIYYLKTLESGRMDDLSDNPGRFIAEGLDRGGLFPLLFEVNNIGEKIGAPGLYSGLQSLFPDRKQGQPASRYAVRSLADSYAGPTFGLVSDVAGLAGTGVRNMRAAMGDQDATSGLTKSDIAAMRRLTPFASLPLIRSAVQYGIVNPAEAAAK